MRVKDRNLNVLVEVYEPACVRGKKCYWPRIDPGVFTQGRGYSGGGKEWLCGTRHAYGCPSSVADDPAAPADSEGGEP